MDKKLIYIIGGVVVIFAIYLSISGEDKKAEEPKIGQTKTEDAKPKKDVEIKYEMTKKQESKQESKPLESQRPAPVPTPAEDVKPKEEDVKLKSGYALVGSQANTQDYTIVVSSETKVEPKRGVPPTLPATIKGSIDGQSFVINIPTNLQNSDLKLRVIEKKSGTEKEINVDIPSLKPASVNILTAFFSDAQNAHLIKGEPDVGDMPPMPPMLR